MKSSVLWALIVLNAALLAAFLWRIAPESTAVAQPMPARPPGDYLMIPAEVNGAPAGIVVVVDQANGELSALSYDESNQRVEHMPKMDLRALFQGGAPARGARGGNR